MKSDKLAVLATILGVGYLMFRGAGVSVTTRPAMPAPVAVYHPPVRVYHPPIRVYYPPSRVYHPPRRKIPIIFRSSGSLPILHRQFPHPSPKRHFFG